MARQQWQPALLIPLLALALTGCLPRQYPGAAAGGAMGGFAGAVLDQRNQWQGGVIGATVGAIAGATIAELSQQAVQESARAWQPVEYWTEDRRAWYDAEPLGYEDGGRCRKIRETVRFDGRMVRKRTILICRGGYDNPAYHYNRHADRYERDDD